MSGSSAYPLSDLRVIDLGIFWAGPYAGAYLGAQGADVIKIESARRPDGFRFSNVFPEDGPQYYEASWLWQATNLNKRDLTLDLTTQEGRDVLERLVAEADVLIENFSPRVIDQFDLGYERLAEINPRLIMLRMPAFGLNGPWRDYVGWASVFEQTAGLTTITGFPDDAPVNPGGYMDPIVGMHALVAVLSALEARERTGKGQLIEIAQLEATLALTARQMIDYTVAGVVTERVGNRSREAAPQGVYETADGRWLALAVRHDADFAALRSVLRDAALDAAAYDTAESRAAHADELDERIGGWASGQPSDQALAALRKAEIPSALVLDSRYPTTDPQLAQRGFYQRLRHPVSGERVYPGWPMRYSHGARDHHRSVTPTLGQHNVQILREVGLGDEDIAKLRDQGIIGDQLEIG